ncbi:hypothetical protein ACLBW0_15335 [Enterobacteriaceae bacterium C34A]
MARKTGLVHGMVICIIALFVISAGSKLIRGNRDSTFECKSDIITRKNDLAGGFVELRLSSVLIYDGEKSLNVIYQGAMKTASETQAIDRTFKMKIKKMPGSDIYQIVDKHIERMSDDSAPPGIVDQLQLDSIDFLYITRVKDNAMMIRSVILPSMICTRL